jgi:hypothetical protein
VCCAVVQIQGRAQSSHVISELKKKDCEKNLPQSEKKKKIILSGVNFCAQTMCMCAERTLCVASRFEVQSEDRQKVCVNFFTTETTEHTEGEKNNYFSSSSVCSVVSVVKKNG